MLKRYGIQGQGHTFDSGHFIDWHHWPIGVDGDVGAVVVEDGAGTVDDFLVVLDLRHDFLLHLQWRQGDFDFTDRIWIGA